MWPAALLIIIHFNENKMKTKPLICKIVTVILLTMQFSILQGQGGYQVSLRVTVIPPVSPYFDQMLQQTAAGRFVVMVAGGSPAGGQLRVKIAGRLERLSPSPFTIALNPNFQPQQPIFLALGAPVTLNSFQLQQTFGNLADNNLALQSVAFGDIKQGINFKLPEGTYRICFTAYNFDQPGFVQPISDPNIGCATFTICYKASAPQFVQPVNSINLNTGVPTVTPSYPLMFNWTVPNSSCGFAIPPLTYDLEIHELFNNQTPTDAINNAPVFLKQGLPSATFLLDTMLYKNVLQIGKTYAIRVHANTANAFASTVALDNNGYSSVQAFQYGSKKDFNPLLVPQPLANKNISNALVATTIISTKPFTAMKDSLVNPYDSVADCGLTPPKDSAVLDTGTSLQNDTLTIGNFKLKATTIKRNADSTYAGSGTIDWKPYVGTIKLAVNFKNIKVNKNKEVFAGLVTSSTDQQKFKMDSVSTFKDFASKTGGQLDQLSSAVDNFINSNKETQIASQIIGTTPVNFPIGLDSQDMGGTKVTVAIMSMAFSPKGATMTVLLSINIPEANGWLSLAGTGFCLQPKGVSFTTGTLFLPNDRYFNIGNGGDSLVIKFKGCPSADSTKGTYVSWSKDSVSAVVAHAEITFPKNSIQREDSAGTPLDSAVVAGLMFRFHKWDDWVASITLPSFQINGVKGLGILADTIFYDHSTKSNAPGFNFPKEYTGTTGTDFEGLYVHDLQVMLPPDFKTFNQGKSRTAFGAKDLILDNKGVSAHLYGTKIIDLKSGDLGGWAFSLDTIEVVVQQNTFQSGTLNGLIQLPISDTPWVYSGDLHIGKDSTSKGKDSSLQYEFVIKPKDTMKINIWAAYVSLSPNSAFRVKKDSLGPAISFVLSGKIGISLSGGSSPGMNFPGLKFDSMGIANRDQKTNQKKFWFSPGTWAFASPQKTVSGFPVSINNVAPLVDMSDQSNIKVGVKFDLNINLGFGDASVVSATTTLGVYGKINASFQNMAPQITLSGGVDVDSILIKGGVGPVTVNGVLVFYNHDNTYGDGMKGHVQATFPLVTVEATAQFGLVNSFNYWYIDACATFPTIPVVGPIGINGFGGGAYYNMVMGTNLPADPSNLQASTKSNDSIPGHSMSGVSFTPQQGAAGIRATVCIAMVSGAGADAMNAKVTLTAQIVNGAFDLLDLHGDVFVLTNFPSNSNPTVKGTVDISYDFAQNKFSLAADIQGQFATITAEIPIGIYGGPDGWYFKVGDAFAKRVSFTLVDIKNDIFSMHLGATAYFEMGSLINPQLPDLPTQITSNGLTRDPSATALIDAINQTPGEGMMFGAEVDGSLNFSFAFLYAKASAIVGFDMILKHFDNSFQCNQQAAGWQNWYALGQIYAYLDVDVGIHIDVWFYQGDLSLCKLQVSALLTGGLPNPTWLDGDLQIDGEVLNGFIAVHTSFHFTVGEKCYPAPDPLKDLQIISDYGPKSKGGVLDYPYVVSNVGLLTTYNVDVPPTQDHPDGDTRIFRFDIESYSISGNGQNIQSYKDYEDDNTVCVFKHKEMLQPHTTYTVTVVCNIMQYYPDQSRWYFPYNDKDQQQEPMEQTTTFTFTTGAAPGNIPESNVHLSYPVNLQRYVLKQEMGGKGVLNLNEWQPNFLTDKNNSTTSTSDYRLYFIDRASNDTVKTSFTADQTTNTINYNIPAELKNNTMYTVQFYSLPKSSVAEPKISTTITNSTRVSHTVSYTVQQRSVSGSISQATTSSGLIYTLYFRTSQFNTLSDKLNALGNWNGARNGDNVDISNDATAPEGFDRLEVKGFSSPDGTSYPSLFQARIEWNTSQQNDKFADDNLYGNALSLAFKLVRSDFGTPELREQIYKPVNTLDWSSFPADAPLGLSETMGAVAAQALTSNTQVKLGGSSGQTTQTSTTSTSRSGSAMSSSSGIGMKQTSMISAIKISQGYQIKWTRDYYIRQDYAMLNAFGLTAQTQAAIIQHQLDPGDQENTLGEMDGDISFASNNIGGTISMPWNKFYYLYTDSKSMAIISNLRNLKYTPISPGARTMNFRYQAGPLQGNIVTKSFTIK
jgi:hypothetical protein